MIELIKDTIYGVSPFWWVVLASTISVFAVCDAYREYKKIKEGGLKRMGKDIEDG